MATESSYNTDTLANSLFTSLTSDAPTPPEIDLSGPEYTFSKDVDSEIYKDVTTVTLAELTTTELDGEGVFDKMMQTVDLHIAREFKGNRITGDQYAKVYTEVMTSVMAQSVQFVLAKDQAKWAAITAQMQARIAEIQATEALINLEKTKVETQKSIFEMQNSGAEYALTKMQIANADAQYGLTKTQTAGEQYKLEHLMPAELAVSQYERMEVLPSTVNINKMQADRILPAEAALKEFQHREILTVERDLKRYELTTAAPAKVALDKFQVEKILPVQLGMEQHKLNFQMPAQTALIKEQHESQRAQTLDNRSDNLTPISGLLGRQKDSIVQDIASKQFNVEQVLPVQLDLVKEQREAERSKTLDTRTDNTIIKGSVGKQKDLYTQQIDSFIKDAKHKTAKMYLDGWITQKTLDENLFAPTQLTNDHVNAVMASIRSENGL